MMKKSKKFTIILGVLITLVMPLLGHTSEASAATFLGLRPWYEGLTHTEDEYKEDENGRTVKVEVERVDCVTDDGSDGCWKLSTFIWTAVTNVASDMAIIAALCAIGFVIYGGYLYLLSGGEAAKVYTGKKTIMNSLIGLAIVALAHVIFTSIRTVLLSGNNFKTVDVSGKYYDAHLVELTDPGLVVTDLISWVVGIAGIVCVIFLVYGGVSYILSSGDANKIKKAKDSILYALIGLAIVGLAQVITALAANTIRDSLKNAEAQNNVSYNTAMLIGKGDK